MKKIFSWSNQGPLGYAVEELTPKGSRRVAYYEDTQENAELMVGMLNQFEDFFEQQAILQDRQLPNNLKRYL